MTKPDQRFPRAMRITRGADFQRIYRQGSRARGKAFTVAVAPNDLEHARLGLSIGKAVWKSAVRRNRVRRLLREAFRLSRPELPAGVDIVVIGSVPRLDLELEATRRELARLVDKAWARYRARAPRP